MRKSLSAIIAGILVLSSPCFAGQQDKTITVHVLHTMSPFVVKLPSNPTTGFEWKLVEYDESLLKLLSSVYQPKSTNLVGSGGATLFTFQLQNNRVYPSVTQMLFQYQRPWTASGATQTKVMVKFD